MCNALSCMCAVAAIKGPNDSGSEPNLRRPAGSAEWLMVICATHTTVADGWIFKDNPLIVVSLACNSRRFLALFSMDH